MQNRNCFGAFSSSQFDLTLSNLYSNLVVLDFLRCKALRARVENVALRQVQHHRQSSIPIAAFNRLAIPLGTCSSVVQTRHRVSAESARIRTGAFTLTRPHRSCGLTTESDLSQHTTAEALLPCYAQASCLRLTTMVVEAEATSRPRSAVCIGPHADLCYPNRTASRCRLTRLAWNRPSRARTSRLRLLLGSSVYRAQLNTRARDGGRSTVTRL